MMPMTPASVLDGTHAALVAKRQATLDMAYAAHPSTSSIINGKPLAAQPPDAVYLNKPVKKAKPVPHCS